MMGKNIVERGRPQMAIWRMHIACWILKVTNTHTHTRVLKYSLLFSCKNCCRTHLNVTAYVHCLPCCCSCHSQTAIIFLYTITKLVLLMDTDSIVCEVQTEYLCLLQITGIAFLKIPSLRPLCLLIRKMKNLSIYTP
jgi:hypothetical protein